MSALKLSAKYALFASLATLINVLAQEMSLLVYAGVYSLYSAVLTGTVAGLVSKYWFDKHYIFIYTTESARHNLSTFIAYTLTGGFTTFLFWSFEIGFEFWFGTKLARYTGAVIGLSLGYVVKYQLDKRYVFNSRSI
ncbi:MAG: GtrA family protein [Gammaproteobacteria bacterium]